MADFQSITTVVRTADQAHAGMDGLPWLIVNQNGFDRLNLRLWSQDTTYGGCDRGQSLRHFQALPVGGLGTLSDENLDPLYVRIGANGSNQWLPELMFVYARSPKGILPLALTAMSGIKLSSDPLEGFTTFPVPRVRVGDDATSIGRLLLVVTTMDEDSAGTDDAVSLEVLRADGAALAIHEIPDTAQRDFEPGTAGVYEIPVEKAFTRADLAAGTVRLRIGGNDQWAPNSLSLFGLDRAPHPQVVVPLAFQVEPGPLSGDPAEGTPTRDLTIYSP